MRWITVVVLLHCIKAERMLEITENLTKRNTALLDELAEVRDKVCTFDFCSNHLHFHSRDFLFVTLTMVSFSGFISADSID